jgi:RND family efflux transporter MFP subunit
MQMILYWHWIIFILLILAGCRKEREQKAESVVYLKVQPVRQAVLVPVIRSAGRLASKVESRLGFKTGGIIEKIAVREAERVNKGKMLAVLELSEIRSREAQARLAVNKAERDFQRATNLYRDSVVTLELYQNAETALEVARSDLKIAQFNLEHSRILAPANGLILKKLAEENEIVGPGQPVLYFASTENEWITRVSVTDKDRVHLNIGDSARIVFDAFPGRHIRATITEIAIIADPYTGTYEIELSLEEQIPSPVNGLIGTVNIYPSRELAYPIVPYKGLIEGNGKSGQLWVLNNGIPEIRDVTMLDMLDDGILIEKGLSAGDTLVVEGGHYIRSDSRIVIEVIESSKQVDPAEDNHSK